MAEGSVHEIEMLPPFKELLDMIPGQLMTTGGSGRTSAAGKDLKRRTYETDNRQMKIAGLTFHSELCFACFIY